MIKELIVLGGGGKGNRRHSHLQPFYPDKEKITHSSLHLCPLVQSSDWAVAGLPSLAGGLSGAISCPVPPGHQTKEEKPVTGVREPGGACPVGVYTPPELCVVMTVWK